MIPLSYLVDKVLVLVNEINPQLPLFEVGEYPRSIKDTISELMSDAVFFVQQNKSYGMLNAGVYNPEPSHVTDNGDGTGSIVLPDDFVSLVKLQMEGWERPCVVTYPSLSPVAVAQHNINTRAGVSKPVCVEDVDSKGRPVLVYYSLPDGSLPVVKVFVYEKEFNPQEGLSTSFNNPLLWAVVYQCAGLLYNVFERRESASAFMALAQSWCKKAEKE